MGQLRQPRSREGQQAVGSHEHYLAVIEGAGDGCGHNVPPGDGAASLGAGVLEEHERVGACPQDGLVVVAHRSSSPIAPQSWFCTRLMYSSWSSGPST